eukprot:TRINITY_DN42943_c0_g1_i1.p1 TRINITY_DN42943_c0_g1~~TRINITY_DN42943_c0_g1_i1.p1  ORF type:complete len:130 (-),score=14.37 TRINITY_DN42943_c0_g1_i1:172-561(-)
MYAGYCVDGTAGRPAIDPGRWGEDRDEFPKCTTYKGLKSMTVEVDGTEEEVLMDDEHGPLVYQRDGSTKYSILHYAEAGYSGGGNCRSEKCWKYMSSTEQKTMIHVVAKKNRRLKEQLDYKWQEIRWTK